MTKGKMNIEGECEANVAKSDPTAGAPTPETISAAVLGAMGLIGDAFTEHGQRIRGDNGKLYRVGSELPEGVTESQIEDVNELAYIQRQVASVLPWKFETMLQANASAQADARRQLAWARGQVAEGKADDWLPESKARFVDQLEYQQAILEVAFGSAMEGYAAVTGEAYVTAAERQAARIRASAKVAKAAQPEGKAAAFRAAA